MTSNLSSDLFALHDLSKVCFLVVAEQLDNAGRRNLSQTCRRFRQLLIPDDRYSSPMPSPLDQTSVDKRSRLETRRQCTMLRISEELAPVGHRFSIELHYCQQYRYVQIKEQVVGNQPSGFYTNTGRFRDLITGKMPEVLHESIHQLSTYFFFPTLNVHIESDRGLTLVLSLFSRFRGTLITISLFIFGDNDPSDDEFSMFFTNIRETIPEECTLQIHIGGEIVPNFRRLNVLIRPTIPDAEWDHSEVQEEFTDVAFELKKRNGQIIGKYSEKFANLV